VLFVGRLSARKGFDLFAQSIDLLLTAVPTARVVIVGHDVVDAGGSAWQQYGQPLKHRHGDRVDWRSEVSEYELDELYWASDVCALPSRYESFGLVFAEAGLRGLPVVAWDIPFAREVGAGTAVLVPPWHAAAYAEALGSTLLAVAEGRLGGDALRRVAEERYSLNQFVERTEALYAGLAATGRRSRRSHVWFRQRTELSA
jgi:glycosyltransferase involved in cell wall biosynthesis